MTKTKDAPKKSSKEVSDDIYNSITDKIIASLEKGVRPWTQPWAGGEATGAFPVRANGESYNGINVLVLWLTQAERGYGSNQWFGFNAAKALGGTVRKGEKGTKIVYYSPFIPSAEKARAQRDGDDPKKAFMLKASYVWNVEQIDDLPEKYYPVRTPVVKTEADRIEKIDHAEKFFAATGITVKHGGKKAHYIPSEDYIELPDFDAFKDAESYYATRGHESVHATGAKHRLDRPLLNRYGTEAYAAEELIAEIGSAFLCVKLGLTPEIREDHTQYIAGWLQILKNDNRFIITASSQAQKAVKFLSGEKTTETEEAPTAKQEAA